jgi:hypothetical protein
MKSFLPTFISGLFLTLFSLSVAAQVNQTDAKGKKQGPWRKSYPNSSVLVYEGTFKDDRPVGTFTYYFESGAKKAIIEHGLKGGKSAVLLFFENGQLLSDGFYHLEKKDSLWYNYAPSGELISAENYKNDLLHGKAVYYYKEGQVLEHKLQVERKVNYQAGKLHGVYQAYFYNGKLKQEGTFEKGLKQGIWTEYNSAGQKVATMKYDKDLLHGWLYTFNKDGSLLSKVLYLDGVALSEKDTKAYLERCKALNIAPVQ